MFEKLVVPNGSTSINTKVTNCNEAQWDSWLEILSVKAEIYATISCPQSLWYTWVKSKVDIEHNDYLNNYIWVVCGSVSWI